MIDQVLMNLAVNARDAMAHGGKLIIETSAAEFDEMAASESSKIQPGSYACPSVSDTGCGIAREHIQRIFEPFFTTKEVGKGTGLGLATVSGIVQQHQGWINIYSEVGLGTTFRIYFPLLAKEAEERKEQSIPATVRGGNETILLVEDDSFLRAAVSKVLAQLGYRASLRRLTVWCPPWRSGNSITISEIQLLLDGPGHAFGGITGVDSGTTAFDGESETQGDLCEWLQC